ncbi:MAG: hypothetical protein U1F42_07055 [Candidatus Competibacteraceae bacterium]
MTRISDLENEQRRNSNRASLSVCAAVLFWLLGVAGFPPAAHSNVPAPSLTAWLSESRLPLAVHNAFRARFAADPEAYEWLVAQEQQVYALAYKPLSPATPAQIQQALRGQTEQQARQLLFLYAAGEHYQQQGFGNREAIAKALATLEQPRRGDCCPACKAVPQFLTKRLWRWSGLKKTASPVIGNSPHPSSNSAPLIAKPFIPPPRRYSRKVDIAKPDPLSGNEPPALPPAYRLFPRCR